MDIDSAPNGFVKRKSRASLAKSVNYKDDSESDDGAPLVRKISCVVAQITRSAVVPHP
jgi:DNA topoisomerase-1